MFTLFVATSANMARQAELVNHGPAATANLRRAAATSHAETNEALVTLSGIHRTIFCAQEVERWPGLDKSETSFHPSTLASISFAGYVCYRKAGCSTAVILHDSLVEHVVFFCRLWLFHIRCSAQWGRRYINLLTQRLET